jgi:hypothetical protein
MINSTSGTAAPGLMTALMNEATSKQSLEIALVKKTQDVEKAQGEAALKLIDSAQVVKSGGVDVYA